MRATWRFVFAGLALSILLACGAALVRVAFAGPQSSDYHQVKKITLGGDGRWDYFEVEQATHRIFIPRGTHVMVLDADGNLLGDIKGLEGTHGIDFAPGAQARVHDERRRKVDNHPRYRYSQSHQ